MMIRLILMSLLLLLSSIIIVVKCGKTIIPIQLSLTTTATIETSTTSLLQQQQQLSNDILRLKNLLINDNNNDKILINNNNNINNDNNYDHNQEHQQRQQQVKQLDNNIIDNYDEHNNINNNINNNNNNDNNNNNNDQTIMMMMMMNKKPKYNWWRLGTRKNYVKHYLHLNATTFKQKCPTIEFLSPIQKELCLLHPNLLNTVSRGARFGIEECQFQFKMNRWNCTAMDADSVFGPIIDINSREKAFIHAISTAGVVYSVTRACTKGELNQCGCDDKVKSQDVQGKWDWGGCSDDIYYGSEFTRRFIDSIEDPNTSEGVMNLHNNEVGRRIIKSKMELVCKCHGVSGSCTVKVCWRRIKPFREVGQELAQKFDGATHVKIVQSRKKRSRLKPAQKNVKRPSKRDLVYLEDSPDFCFKNTSHGSFGTTDRICNSTSYGLDGCRYLCCGRGYRTIERYVDLKCNCKFVWCCKVKCDQCRTKLIEHHCN